MGGACNEDGVSHGDDRSDEDGSRDGDGRRKADGRDDVAGRSVAAVAIRTRVVTVATDTQSHDCRLRDGIRPWIGIGGRVL